MTSRLENLLTQEEPLEQHEIADLEEWLLVLKEDCEMFGATAEDIMRAAQIRMKIQAQSI
jgi:hypothetical protein